ncbi:MAG: hypothetical protein LVR00_01415 [Rhabdochlamydiaceae bacterium]|jgi:hypothetical protein
MDISRNSNYIKIQSAIVDQTLNIKRASLGEAQPLDTALNPENIKK